MKSLHAPRLKNGKIGKREKYDNGAYCAPKVHVQTTSVPQQSIQNILHIARTFLLSLAIDYCTLVRGIQVNKVFISLLAVETQGLPNPSCSRFQN